MINARSNILCVFEGERREVNYFNNMVENFFNTSSIVHCCYGNDLYELEKSINSEDDPEDLDIFEVLKENNTVKENDDFFARYTRDSFNQVYLFFDLEYHDNLYCPDKVKRLVNLFHEETELGKLFISYPMVEAIRDIPDYVNFHRYTVSLDEAQSKIYKSLSAKRLGDFVDPRKITKDKWNALVKASVSKANFIVNNNKHLDTHIEQVDILDAQLNLIAEEKKISVLSSYPMFLRNQFSMETFV
ncbi:hypothetical protein DM586_06710 [Vibrio fluvialis]|uniref:hypothetical protein n=1 Tax=Vibrio fluvialis TaxID=676 RepID=UPI00117C5898|nr:hypothetical protein [Vibrio fluvialis]TRN15714.1 hypothetical protein DM586_06710 [Vibrio fluvialis]